MTTADEYRVKAAELSALARQELNQRLQSEYERLARSYVVLAMQADRNSKTDVVYESASAKPRRDSQVVQQQQQQQQQAQPAKEPEK